ncbi:MAG TPA: RNA polymerase sigma factor [Tepidisphaeraceae bacterium]|nr:RNA polymerase sigma factor [Tepidisphaeraceae bacterium]
MNAGMGPEHDEWLMAQVADGRAEKLETLIRRYGTLLLTFIWHMVGDRQRSEDIFQDVFLAVWMKRRQYRFPRPFKPWLYQIAINRCRALFRPRAIRLIVARGEDPPFEEALAGSPSPPDTAIAMESATLVQVAVAQLPPRQRLVVVMRLWNDFSYAQIAQMLGIREATVRSTMHDALASLRRYLEPRM